jgi:sister-chromatid-cohesion protein PDS5
LLQTPPLRNHYEQDPCFQVRMVFLTKLIALLTPRRLAPRFNVIPFLTVLDPEPEVKKAVCLILVRINRLILTLIVGYWICIIYHSKPAFRYVASLPTAILPDLALQLSKLTTRKPYLFVCFIYWLTILTLPCRTNNYMTLLSQFMTRDIYIILLSAFSRYVDFYLDLVTTSDNISLLYHLAMKAKTVRDAESHTYSEVSAYHLKKPHHC